MHARGRTRRRGRGKIAELRREAREDLGVAAACLLAALGREGNEDQTDNEFVRAYAGALLIAEGLVELTRIRKLLTAPER